jgi:hypothetical protein
MPLNFPTTGLTANITTYTFSGNTWIWNGYAWDTVVTPASVGLTAYVRTWNGQTGDVAFSNYVTSVNGLTGAITGIAVTGANTFAGLQTMNAGITASTLYVSGGVTFGPYTNNSTVVIDSPYVALGDLNGEGENIRIVIDNSIPAITINGGIAHGSGTINSSGTIQGNVITSDTYVSATQYVSSPQYLDSYSFVQTFRTTTTAATANQTIAQIDVVYTTDGPTMVYPSFEATISAWDSVLNKTEILKMLIVQNGTDTVNTQYGLIRTGATGPVSSYSTTLQTVATEKNLLIRATPSTSNPTQFTVTVRAHNGT